MTVLPILIAPHPMLSRIAKPVEAVDDRVRRLMDDMLETMYAAPGIGLAAPQVGISERVLVADVSAPDDPAQPVCMANPEIIGTSPSLSLREEGCLSLPDHFAEVQRPETVRIRYLDYENEVRETDYDGLLATCLQHEIDHLDGVIFVDYLSRLKRSVILRKLTKAKKTELRD